MVMWVDSGRKLSSLKSLPTVTQFGRRLPGHGRDSLAAEDRHERISGIKIADHVGWDVTRSTGKKA